MSTNSLFFLLLSNIPWYGLSLFNYSPVEGHLGCFQFGAIMYEVANKCSCKIIFL